MASVRAKYAAIICERLKQGDAPRIIVSQFPVTSRMISYYAKLLGLRFESGRPPGRTPRSIARQSEARRLKASGWTYKRIANKFGVTSQRVQFLLRIPKHKLAKRCQSCGSQKILCGHHLDYLNNRFQTLCQSCHVAIHQKLKRPKTR